MIGSTISRAAASVAAKPIARALERTKVSTGIVGLALEPQPISKLKAIYTETLTQLESLPSSSVYRQSVAALTSHRLQLASEAKESQGEDSITSLEQEIDQGSIESVIAIAQDELKLIKQMHEWKAWEDLVEKPAADQWQYFEPPPSTTMPSSS